MKQNANYMQISFVIKKKKKQNLRNFDQLQGVLPLVAVWGN